MACPKSHSDEWRGPNSTQVSMTAEGSNQRGGWQVVGQVITEGMSSGWEAPSFSHSTILENTNCEP